MVTTAQARQQLSIQRQSLQQQRQQIQQTRLRALTRAEVAKQTKESIAQRQIQSTQLEGQKRQALKTLKLTEKQFEVSEKAIKNVEAINAARNREIAEWKLARKLINTGRIVEGASDPSIRSKIKELQAKGLTIPIPKSQQVEVKIETIPAFRNIFTGEIIRQSIRPEDVPTHFKPIQVSAIPSAREKLLISLGLPPIIPIEEIKDIKKPLPPTISLPTPTPKITTPDEILKQKIISGIQTIGKPIKDIVGKVGEATVTLAERTGKLITIPASSAKEGKVELIKLPSIPGGTQQTRPVDFRDVDKGILPPQQNLELKVNRTLFKFSQGQITETKALAELEAAQKKFILDESKRTAALRFVEGAGIGILTVLAPPVGMTLIGLSGADAIAKRREVLAFAKANPKAAAIQFVAGVAGGLIAGGGIKAIKTKSITFREPTIKLTGQARTKFIKNIIKRFEPDQRVELAKNIKETSTRTFSVDIPSPKNKVSLKIVEFTKDGSKRFAGLEYINGKPNSAIGGFSFVKGKGGDARIITRSIRTYTKRGLTNLELAEYLERVKTKAVKSKGLRSAALTENEVKLSKKFDLKGLTPDQVREVLRRPLFGVKESQRRMNNPFTDAEFNRAVGMSKSQFTTVRDIVKARVTNLDKQLGSLIAERDIIDIRVLERGAGTVDIKFNLPQPTFKFKPKIGRTRVPGKASGIGIVVKKLKKGEIPRTPKRTPLSRTFADETSQILQQEISKANKVKLLQKLKQDVSPVGAFKSIAKRIQQERINLAIRRTKVKVGIKVGIKVGVATGIASAQDFKNLSRQKQVQLVKTLSKQKNGQTLGQVSTTIVKEAEKMALGGKITQVQLQTLKSKLLLRQRIITPTARKLTPPTKIPPPPVIIKVPSGVSKTKTVKALAGLGKQGVDIIIGLKERKKQILRKNLPAFKALKFGRAYVDRNIQASFRLVPSGKKAKGKDIQPMNIGIKFRPSKTNPLFLVEKRKFRIDHPKEKAALRRARKITSRKKVKRRRKK